MDYTKSEETVDKKVNDQSSNSMWQHSDTGYLTCMYIIYSAKFLVF